MVDPDGGYMSDFDVLAVVNHEELADVAEYWRGAEGASAARVGRAGGGAHPGQPDCPQPSRYKHAAEAWATVFHRHCAGRILLHDTPGYTFDPAKPLSVEAAREEAHGYFEEWFRSVGPFIRGANYAQKDADLRKAAFDLHQATERLYHCTLLVLKLYSPKSHKLNFLRSQAERLAPALIPGVAARYPFFATLF